MTKLITSLFMLLTCFTFGQTPDLNFIKKIDSIINANIVSNQLIGIAIGIVKNQKICYVKGYGIAELNSIKAVDSMTNFHTASISKVFVTTAIMQLQEQGKLDINKKLLDYIPSYKIRDKRFRDITIKQMLNHTSGIRDLFNYRWYKPKTDSVALKNYALRSIRKKLKFTPGTKNGYSNRAYEILGYLIEIVSKKPFEDYLQENVLNKSGMNHSSFNYYNIDSKRRSLPYGNRLITGRVKKVKYYPYNKEHGPSSTLNSCSYDMSKWIIENINIYNDSLNAYQGVVKRELLLDMWTPTYRFKDSVGSVGLGWWVWQTKTYGQWFVHDGGDKGYSSQLMICPKQNFGFILLANVTENDAIYRKIPNAIVELMAREWKNSL